MPVYFVVVRIVPNMMRNIWQIIKVIPCDVTVVESLWKREIAGIHDFPGENLTYLLFAREPDNPFREKTR